MSVETISLINLPYWETGGCRIRFLYLVGENSFQLTEPTSDQEPAIPLFLGADVFSNTDVRVENHPRYHAKFSKKGLATKLLFCPAFRFQGLRVPWSGNGLWFYSVDGVFRVAFELFPKRDQLSVLETFQDLWKSRLEDEQLNQSYNMTAQLAPQLSDPVDPEIRTETRAESADHCSLPEGVVSGLARTFRDLADTVEHSSLDQEQERSLIGLTGHIRCFIEGRRQDEAGLTEAVMSLLRTPPELCVYSGVLLRELAGWLGRRFHQANRSVSHRVEGFKLRHIEHVQDLPPAEDLATQLFPEAMRSLLIHWMGLGEEAGAWRRSSEYPIVLLILEFANHNLITGVAHVLYSSLILKDPPRLTER